jgi:NAD(P)-dependent dehydrogenase (short-subunit alcohol dehydrogenase family)
MSLSGRRALVAGGAGHLGLAAGEAMAELGATMAILDVDAAGCEKRVQDLSRVRNGCAIAAPCDLRDEQSTRGAVKALIRSLGGLDIVIHCAAYVGTTAIPGWAVPFEEQTVAAWTTAMHVNLTSAFVIVQEARDALAASGRGSVILVASTYGMVGPDMRLYAETPVGNTPAGYAASKGGLLQLGRYLATVLAPRIRVNAITPGGVERGQAEAFQQRYVARTPLGRMAIEEDLKGAVAYLASDLSAYVTGHNLVVDGGWTAW